MPRGLPAPVAAASLLRDGPGLRGSVLRGAGGTLAVRIISALLAFVSTVILTRVLGAEGYGAYAWAFSAVSSLAVLATAGLDQLVIRDLPAARVRGAARDLRGLVSQAPLLIVLAGSLLAGVAGLLAGALEDDDVLVRHLRMALALCPLLALGALGQGVLTGLGRPAAGLAVAVLVRQGLFLAAVGAVALLAGDPGSEEAVLLQVAAAALAAAAVGVLARRAMGPLLGSAPPGRPGLASHVRERLAASVPMGISGGAATLAASVPVLVVGGVDGAREAGVLAAATVLLAPFSFLFSSTRAALAPVISRLWAAGQLERLQRGITSATRGVAAVGALAALALTVAAGPLLGIFGEAFGEGAGALRILAAGSLVNTVFAFNGTLLNMTGHHAAAGWSALAALAAELVLAFALVPPLGLEGAALAFAISVTARNLLNTAQAWRRVGVDAGPLGRR